MNFMKTFLICLSLLLAGVLGAAVPPYQRQLFTTNENAADAVNANQLAVTGGKLSIKSGVLLTNVSLRGSLTANSVTVDGLMTFGVDTLALDTLNSVLLRTDASGKPSETTIGSGLSFDGTTLSASGGGFPLTADGDGNGFSITNLQRLLLDFRVNESGTLDTNIWTQAVKTNGQRGIVWYESYAGPDRSISRLSWDRLIVDSTNSIERDWQMSAGNSAANPASTMVWTLRPDYYQELVTQSEGGLPVTRHLFRIGKTNTTFTIMTNWFALTNDGSGPKVGIGTATPANPLQVQVGTADVTFGTFGSGFGAIGFDAAALTAVNYAFAGDGGLNLLVNRVTGGSVQFRENNGTAQMSIIAGGNVGIGTTTPTNTLSVNGTTMLQSNVWMSTNSSLVIASGPKQRAGNATLVAGTVTVANTSVTANTIVNLTRKTAGGTIGTQITYTLSAGASFTITSDSAADTSTFSYFLLENP